MLRIKKKKKKKKRIVCTLKGSQLLKGYTFILKNKEDMIRNQSITESKHAQQRQRVLQWECRRTFTELRGD